MGKVRPPGYHGGMNLPSLAALLALSVPAFAGPAACPDAPQFDGRSLKVTLTPESGKPIALELSYQSCDLELPREEPDQPYTRRVYLSAEGAVSSLATGEQSYSGMYLTLKDGRSVVLSPIPNDKLDAGPVAFEGALLVKGAGPDLAGGSVTKVRAVVELAPRP